MTKIRKRSILLLGRKTSISLEDEFWAALQEVAESKELSPVKLVSQIAQVRGSGNLSSAVRVFLLEYFRSPRSKPPRNL